VSIRVLRDSGNTSNILEEKYHPPQKQLRSVRTILLRPVIPRLDNTGERVAACGTVIYYDSIIMVNISYPNSGKRDIDIEPQASEFVDH
jgi:hypothetical protein